MFDGIFVLQRESNPKKGKMSLVSIRQIFVLIPEATRTHKGCKRSRHQIVFLHWLCSGVTPVVVSGRCHGGCVLSMHLASVPRCEEGIFLGANARGIQPCQSLYPWFINLDLKYPESAGSDPLPQAHSAHCIPPGPNPPSF